MEDNGWNIFVFSYMYVKINESKCAGKCALFKVKKEKTRVVSCTCMCERYYIYVFEELKFHKAI